MRLKHFEETSDGGAFISATVVSQEGIWHLFNMIAVGDVLRSKTVRKVVRETATGGTSQKRTFTLSIRVTQAVEYDAVGRLRISGQNQTECEDVPLQSYHTIDVCYDPPQDFKLWKSEWNPLLAQRLKEATNVESKSDTGAIIMQNGLAQICFINGTMCTTRAKVELYVPKKRRGSSQGRDDTIMKFYGQVMEAIIGNMPMDKMRVVLVCSPGHVREEFMAYVMAQAAKAEAPPPVRALATEHKSKFVLCRVSTGHRSALQEALADPKIQQRLTEARAASDVKTFRDFQDMMAKEPDRCVYGVDGVFAAMHDQCIDTLLLLDELLRSPEPQARHLYTSIAEETQELGGNVQVFSSIGVTGDQLKAITGIAAILRAPMPQLDDIEVNEDFVKSETVAAYLRSRNASALREASGMVGSNSSGA